MNALQLHNEADVREDVAAPFLRKLGYARGTENDIQRECLLRYDRLQLGRKKANDLPLGGKADYLLVVYGAGRWVLETKPPNEEIDIESIDQALSYARHPEVCAHYAAILNGKRFVLFDRTRNSNDTPLVDLTVVSAEKLADSVESLLSPVAIRRDCGPPIVDLARGLAKGFRSRVAILNGEVTQVENRWVLPISIPWQVEKQLQATGDKLLGQVSTVRSGEIWRDDCARIRAKLKWNLPHEQLASFMQQSKMEDFEYICHEDEVSDDPEKPSLFEMAGSFRLEAGKPLFNILRWQSTIMTFPAEITVYGQALGILKGSTFSGLASMEQMIQIPLLAQPISFMAEYKFSVTVDAR